MSTGGDCGLRCYTERKNYCKDLHKWGKNLLYMIGLECVAKKLTNRRSWEKISPFLKAPVSTDQEKENFDPVDWKPADFCPVCSGRRFSAMEDIDEIDRGSDETVKQQPDSSEDGLSSISKKEPEALASSSTNQPKQLNFDFLFSNGTNSAPETSALTIGPMFGNPFNFFGFGSQSYVQQLLQWSAMLNPALYSTPQNFMPFLPSFGELQQTQNGILPDAISSIPETSTTQQTKSTGSQMTGGEQPLDLSQKSKGEGTKFQPATAAGVSDFLAKGLAGFGKPSQSATANGSNGNSNGSKRNYTQLDLEAAVKDIRSGRLGTRRASVVYGIPRSTLRNKIYKLEAAEETGNIAAKKARRTGVAISSSPLDCAAPPVDEDSNLSVDKRVIADGSSPSPNDNEDKKDEKLKQSETVPFLDESFKETVTNVLAKNRASHLADELSAVNLRWSNMGIYPPKSAAEALIQHQWYRSPVVSAAVKAASQEAFKQCWGDDDDSTKFLLKEYKQHFGGLVGADKERERTETPSAAASGSGSESPQNGKSITSKDTGDDSWKKSRPKRGQYRKYDKNALDEAVRTVRRGEMSVHRAGSYYGVPHSTLEYKVKERNLLRPKKKDSKKTTEEAEDLAERKTTSPRKPGASRKRKSDDGSTSGQVSPSSKEVLDSLQDDEVKSPSSNIHAFNGSSTPNSPTLSISGPESMPTGENRFLFGGNPSATNGMDQQQAFFASDMMRRLQAEAVNPSFSSSRTDPQCATQ